MNYAISIINATIAVTFFNLGLSQYRHYKANDRLMGPMNCYACIACQYYKPRFLCLTYAVITLLSGTISLYTCYNKEIHGLKN